MGKIETQEPKKTVKLLSPVIMAKVTNPITGEVVEVTIGDHFRIDFRRIRQEITDSGDLRDYLMQKRLCEDFPSGTVYEISTMDGVFFFVLTTHMGNTGIIPERFCIFDEKE